MDDQLDPPEGDDFYEQDGPGLFGFDEVEPSAPSATSPDAGRPDSAVPTTEATQAPIEVGITAQADVLVERGTASLQAPPTPLALYRRYRPETFDEVIGQEHVTEPLRRALLNNRVNHAYLFSGPRGCGKTTSARILARCLNCEQGPTPTPCGNCQSCRDLARGGIGSIDVIEIDAASHGGVEDARDLRERAFFAPVQSRYKVYIVDEAHMVTTAGFNAMLKLVEEPPPHVKFIFATTEPEKVIGTIRSRTHHYPFRLVPPKVLGSYLAKLCEAEGVPVEPTVLPLVVRAGAGSVRDSLSVLDQLLGAAGEHGVSYAQASSLLGYTPDALLDEIVDAFAAGDAGGVMATIDKVIEVGQDPRRFAEDLLRRLRDLVVVAAVPDAVASGLIDVAADQGERLALQASALGPGETTRAAEVIANGLTEMRGTTAPRLYLELMCARVLLPGADVDGRGIHARLDRIERRLNAAGAAQPVADEAAWPASDREAPPPPTEASQPPASREGRREDPTPITSAPGRSERSGGRAPSGRPTERPLTPEPPRSAKPTPIRTPTPPVRAAGELSVADLRRLWPQVLDAVRARRRFPWMLLSQHAQVLDLRDGALVLGFNNQGARDNFTAGGSHDVLRDCLIDLIGVDLRIEAITEGTATKEASAPGSPGESSQGAGAPTEEAAAPAPTGPAPGAPIRHTPSAPIPSPRATRSPVSPAAADPASPPGASTSPADSGPRARLRAARGAAHSEAGPGPLQGMPEDAIDPSDPALEDSQQSAVELIMSELDAEIIPDDDIE